LEDQICEYKKYKQSSSIEMAFYQRLRDAHSYADIKRVQQEMNREITVNNDNYCSQVFNGLVRASRITNSVTSSPPPKLSSSLSSSHMAQQQQKDPTRNLLKELLYMQLLLHKGVHLNMTPSLELFCFKTLIEPSRTFTKDKRVKVLCLLLMQNHLFAENKLPSILEEYFNKNDLVEILTNDIEINPVIFRLLNMFADSELTIRQLNSSVIQPFILPSTFSSDQQTQQQVLKDTHLYTLSCIIPYLMNVLETKIDIAAKFSADPTMTVTVSQIEKVFKSWLLRAGTFTEKKKAVFRGGTTFVTELDGSAATGCFTALNYAQNYSRRQNLHIYLFSTLHSWIRVMYHDQLLLSSIISLPSNNTTPTNQLQPKNKTTSPTKSKQRVGAEAKSLNEWGISPIPFDLRLGSTPPPNQFDSPSAQQQYAHRQHAPMDNELLDTTVQYCLRVVQQAELKYNNNKETAKMLFSSSYIESVLVETIRQLDEICTLYPVVVSKVFPSLKKLFHILCGQRPVLSVQQLQQQQQLLQQLTPSRRKYLLTKSVKPFKQQPSTLQLLQYHAATRSNTGSLFLTLISFFIHHIHTLVYDPQPLFQTFFNEQFQLYYHETLFPIETMILFLDNQKIIHHETRLLDDHYPQLFKLLAVAPHQIVSEFSVILPSIISKSNYIDVFHRILDIPMLSFVLDCDNKKQQIQTTDGVNALFESVVSDNMNSEGDFWSKQQFVHDDWDQLMSNQINYIPEISVQCSQCVAQLLEVYFETLINEANESCLQEILPLILKRVNALFPVNRGNYLSDTRKILLKYFLRILNYWPVFIIDLKSLLLQALQDSKGTVFVNICYCIGECLATCSDDRMTTQVIVQYFEMLELVTFEQLAKVRIEYKMKQKAAKDSDTSTSRVEEATVSDCTQSLNILISAMCKACGRCPDLVSRVVVCLANLIKHADCLHPSVLQRANEATRLLRFPSIVTSLLCSSDIPTQASEANRDGEMRASGNQLLKPTQIVINAKGSHKVAMI
jgi:hypothetical protein